jgi:hypothetical protein
MKIKTQAQILPQGQRLNSKRQSQRYEVKTMLLVRVLGL